MNFTPAGIMKIAEPGRADQDRAGGGELRTAAAARVAQLGSAQLWKIVKKKVGWWRRILTIYEFIAQISDTKTSRRKLPMGGACKLSILQFVITECGWPPQYATL